MKIEFTELDAENWEGCANLWSEEDRGFVSPNTYSIAEAQFYPKAISRAISVDGTMVGYTLFGEDEDDSKAWAIDRFMIAKEHRNKGFGAKAMEAILEEGRKNGFTRFITSTVTTNEPMQGLLSKVGFVTEHEIRGREYVYFREEQPAQQDSRGNADKRSPLLSRSHEY